MTGRDRGRLPSREEVLDFIRKSTTPVGKREIARAFNITGSDRIPLKAMLRELADEGLIGRGAKRKVAPPDALPAVAVLDIHEQDVDGELLARPASWSNDVAPPRIYVVPGQRTPTPPAIGHRILARLDRQADGSYLARVIRRLEAPPGAVLGVFTAVGADGRVQPTDRRIKHELVIRGEHSLGAETGDLVLCTLEPGHRRAVIEGRVVERFGRIDDPRALSLIAIHRQGLPTEFSEAALAEARAATPAEMKGREDLRALPLLTIDPADARDFDDAVWAAPDDDPANPGGFHAVVAIADVAHYVRPGSALDKAALERGNSAYFPDRVVPMLPEELSADLCSLIAGTDRPCMVAKMRFDADGNKIGHSFSRAMIRVHCRLTYRQAQAIRDGKIAGPDDRDVREHVTRLYDAWHILDAARTKRAPLDLDLPERRVEIGEDGYIAAVHPVERLDAHRLVEEFMIQANVAAAEMLEARKAPCMYRVHDRPAAEKVVALADYLQEFDIRLAKGQVIKPAHFNGILAQAADSANAHIINEVILRCQAQAEYSPENYGHFGLNLRRYAHFTSPIRRYADLLVHRSLIGALGFGPGGLRPEDIEKFAEIGEAISGHERRASAAERDALDRFTAVFMADRVGAVFAARVSGATRAGLFVRIADTGADGLIPISSLGYEYFRHDATRHALIGEASGKEYHLGDGVEVELMEANTVTGGLIFKLLKVTEEVTRGRAKAGLAKRRKTVKRTTPKAVRKRKAKAAGKTAAAPGKRKARKSK
ncbi:ribonuclease R [Oceanibacterium hippocampi]|uniref:Ribonuclease R n=1 Tax=Oceanibacterium hippocampi TaxID=745714 RepID=A0A1Y5SMF7_9PROT|nr:ribonuclease R [Oceanibacterium hippocampi]SLN44146.1 Ribonuclease R [Oceanibacterium hippocampi]